MIGAQRSHGPPRGQTWLRVSEPVILNCVFDYPEEKSETGPVPAKPSQEDSKYRFTQRRKEKTQRRKVEMNQVFQNLNSLRLGHRP